MGYYDEPDTADVTVSFTCTDEECGHENKDIETSVWVTSNTAEVDCEKCEYPNTVSLEYSGCVCAGQEFCRC